MIGIMVGVFSIARIITGANNYKSTGVTQSCAELSTCADAYPHQSGTNEFGDPEYVCPNEWFVNEFKMDCDEYATNWDCQLLNAQCYIQMSCEPEAYGPNDPPLNCLDDEEIGQEWGVKRKAVETQPSGG